MVRLFATGYEIQLPLEEDFYMVFKNSILLYCLLPLLFIFTKTSFSQNIGSIHGKVLEKTTSLEFATISLYNETDSIKAIKKTITDSTGNFILNDLPFGKYQLHIQLIGYKPLQQTITLNSQNTDAGILILFKDPKQLQTVTVTAQKGIIQKTAQGFIINASANLTQTGGTATDLLRNTPTVVVDAEGVITIRGKSPLILINGRNSSVTGTDQIPASSIESIEIINNPSAQYDADAEGGIINIKLKKNKQNGTNGALALGAGMGAKGRINSAFLLNHKIKKWNYAMAYDNRFAGRIRNITANRINFDVPDEYYITQSRADNRVEKLQNLRFNIDFSPNAKNVFGFEAIGSIEGQDNEEALTTILQTEDKHFNAKNIRSSMEISKDKVAEFALNYNHKYTDKRRDLSAGISTSFNNDKENTDITTQSLGEANELLGYPFLQKTNNYEKSNVSNIKTDYVHPVSSHAVIETGYKGIFRFLDADFQSLDKTGGVYIPDSLASNIFTFKEQIHAGYIQYKAYTGNENNPIWKYEFGIRAEQVWNNGKTAGAGISFSNQYFNLFPTANIAYYKGQNEFWKMSYSRRINRPGFGQLNPFIDITDSLNQRGGNPYLKPELVHSLELGYNKDWQKLSVYSILYYRYATNTIRPFTIIRPDGVAFTQPGNFGNVTTYGIENILTARPLKTYDFNLSISLFQQNIDGSNLAYNVTNNVFSWNGKLINNFVLWPGSKLQLTGVYNAPIALPQGKRIAVYNVDMGFQQKTGKGKARFGLIVTDIFNTQKSGQLLEGSNFIFNRVAKVDTRAILITYAYTFGTGFKEKLLENKFSND